MPKSIKLCNVSSFNNINYNSQNIKRVNNILFLLNDAIFALMKLNTKVSQAIINDNNEILNAIIKCPTYNDFMINRYMIKKLKGTNENSIKFINVDNTIISIRDLENIFITVHDNYQIDKILEPKFYNDFYKEKSFLDYIMEFYQLNNLQEEILFKILDSITSISEKNINLANKLFSELGKYDYYKKIESFTSLFKENISKEEYYTIRLMEMKDLVDNKNLLKAIKNRVNLFEKYAKATEELLELLPIDVAKEIFNF